MSNIRAYRFQLRCPPSAERTLRWHCGMLRQVWNRALAEQRARHGRGEKFGSYAEMCKWLTGMRNDPETAWLSKGPIHPQQQVLRRLDEAYKRFFEKAGGFPKFKRFGDEPGMRFPDPKQWELDQVNGRVRLPKLGWLRLRQSQAIQGELRNITIRREGGKWFASIQTRSSEIAGALDVGPTLGIDLGVTVFAAGWRPSPAATSEGVMVAPLKALERQRRKLKHLQRSVSRKKRGSSNRKKAVQRLGELHRRIARQRSDWLHQLTTRLVNRHAVIAIEDLKVKNMSASAAGTSERPGKNVRAKSGLNRSILDASWGECCRQIAYKLEWRGGRVIRVAPAYTSRTCRICGNESADNRKTQSVFRCVACGHEENADVHAAKNILAAGHAAWEAERASAKSTDACGGAIRRVGPARDPHAVPMNQEPAEARAGG